MIWQPFVYIWLHTPTGKYYIGSRTAYGCHPNDGYISSSEIILEGVEQAPQEWRREIIKTGTAQQMRDYEIELLEELDVRNDPMSLNQTNGSGIIVLKEKPVKKEIENTIQEELTDYEDIDYDDAVDYGITLWTTLTETLNNIVIEDGEIRKNDRRIWNTFLHRYSNRDWLFILAAAEYMRERHDHAYATFHIDVIDEARDILLKYYHTLPRVLDIKEPGMEHKRVAWKAITNLREVLNNINGIEVFNQVKTTPTSQQRGDIW